MSDQHTDRPDDAPAPAPHDVDEPTHQVDADLTDGPATAPADDALGDRIADDPAGTAEDGAAVDPATPDGASVVGSADGDEVSRDVRGSEARPDAPAPDALPPDVFVADTSEPDALLPDVFVAHTSEPDTSVAHASGPDALVPPDRDVPPVAPGGDETPTDLDAPGDGVPSDVVHVDDDALVRPLDAPLAHVLGEDADDLSVLAAPGDATGLEQPGDATGLERADDAPDVDELAAPALDDPADAPDADHRADAEDRHPSPVAPAIASVGAAAATAAPAPPAASRTGWSVLGHALQPRVNRAQVLAGVLCALLGFALAVQIRQTSDLSLSGMRQADLVRILDEATTRGDALERERADLVDERDELLSGSDTRQAALDALRRSAETQGILAGRLPAEGRGVVVTVSDGGAQVKPVTMLNMLEELRNAGAEAMQLNDLRITASSAFTGTAGAIQLDGVTLAPPYVWKVVGDPDTIATALQMPGGAFAEVRNNGGNAAVEQQDLVEVDAIRVVPDPVHATPVPPAAG